MDNKHQPLTPKLLYKEHGSALKLSVSSPAASSRGSSSSSSSAAGCILSSSVPGPNLPPKSLLSILSKIAKDKKLDHSSATQNKAQLHAKLTNSLFLSHLDTVELKSALADATNQLERATANLLVEDAVPILPEKVSIAKPSYPKRIERSRVITKQNKSTVEHLSYRYVEGMEGVKHPIEEATAHKYFGKEARVLFFAKFAKMQESKLLVASSAKPRIFAETRGSIVGDGLSLADVSPLAKLATGSQEDVSTRAAGSVTVVSQPATEGMFQQGENSTVEFTAADGGSTWAADSSTVCDTTDHHFDQSDRLPNASFLANSMSKPMDEFFSDLQTLATMDPQYKKLDQEIFDFNSFSFYEKMISQSKMVDNTPRSSASSSMDSGDHFSLRDNNWPQKASGRNSSISERRSRERKMKKQLVQNHGRLPAINRSKSRQEACDHHERERSAGQQQQQQHTMSALDIQLRNVSRQGDGSGGDYGTGGAGGISLGASSRTSLPSATAHFIAGGGFDDENAEPAAPSPRTKYLSGCLRENIHPLVNLIVRKKMVTSLDLGHYGMGDKMGVVLSECIQDLPCIESINLNDNNLTDDSLQYLIQSLTEIPTLKDLNLSRNKIDGESSDALADYLARPDCPLVVLTMQSADVDDGEADRFIQCLVSNQQLEELDLSANMLGAAETQSMGDDSVVTGGASVAAFISSSSCRLKVLKLAWNSIRGASGVKLAKALCLNNTITHLDLSNNGMGWAAGEALGDAIMENRILKTLLVSNNNFTSSAIMSICIGAMENLALKTINLNENPIGQAGAKMMMQTSVALGSRIAISAANCNTINYDPRCWYDPASPIRDYSLSLSDPFDRAVAFHLLHTVASHATLIFAESRYEAPNGKSQNLKLIQAVAQDREKFFDEEQRNVVSGLRRLSAAASNAKLGEELFHEADADGGGTLDKEELKDVLDKIGFIVDDERLQDIFAVFDVDGGGSIEMPEFLDLLKSQVAESNARIKELVEYPMLALSSNPKVKYTPPRVGRLHLKVIDGFIRKKNFYTLSVIDQKYAYQMAKGMGDVMMMADAVKNARTRYNEAYAMYKTMYKEVGDKTAVLIKVIPEMMHPWEAKQLVAKATNEDRMEMARVKLAFGVAIRPIFGNYNGYYCLDLSKELHRICLSRLLEQSNTMNSRRAAMSIIAVGRVGDISQHGNWSSFRNEVLNGENIVITPDMFTPMPHAGILEFDFSGATRPTATELKLTDKRLCKVLNNIIMLPPAKNKEVLTRLTHFKDLAHVTNRKGDLFMPMCAYNQQKALDAGLAADDFYWNLDERRELTVLGAKKEEIKVSLGVGEELAPGSGGTTVAEEQPVGDYGTDGIVDGSTDVPGTPQEDQRGTTSLDVNSDSIEEGSQNDATAEDGINDQDTVDGTVDESTTYAPDEEDTASHTADPPDDDGSAFESLEDSMNSESVEMSEDYALWLRKKRIKELKVRLATLLKMSSKKGVSKHAKAARFVDVLEETFSTLWIRSRHLVIILETFNELFGDVARTSFFGSYKVEVVVTLFARVVDLHNFEIVLDALNARECGVLFARIGILNIFNPLKPEVTYELNLARYEDRMVAKMIVYLSVDEPGINLTFKKFQWKREIDPIPGWDVTEPWATEEGMPGNGMFTFTYYSGEGRNRMGCVPNLQLRRALCQLVLIDENEIHHEDDFVSEPVNSAIDHFLAERHMWAEYLVVGCDNPNKKTVFGQNYRYK